MPEIIKAGDSYICYLRLHSLKSVIRDEKCSMVVADFLVFSCVSCVKNETTDADDDKRRVLLFKAGDSQTPITTRPVILAREVIGLAVAAQCLVAFTRETSVLVLLLSFNTMPVTSTLALEMVS